ncbi:MAG TPA: hypothetical protein VF131_28745 [Blastocatellia bacterium]|nr:hypothetical protein [Blastocatellia bacterium]
MRCPKCYVETSNDALCCPGCKLPTPKGRSYLKNKNNKPQARARAKKRVERKRINVSPKAAVFIVVTTMLVCGIGSYIGMTFLEESKAQSTDPSQIALDRLRQLPSEQAGLNVEERLEQEVDKAREAGQLVEDEGWHVTPVEETIYLISFTYEVKGNLQHRAEWMFDQAKDSYVAKTDLAASIYKQ